MGEVTALSPRWPCCIALYSLFLWSSKENQAVNKINVQCSWPVQLSVQLQTLKSSEDTSKVYLVNELFCLKNVSILCY